MHKSLSEFLTVMIEVKCTSPPQFLTSIFLLLGTQQHIIAVGLKYIASWRRVTNPMGCHPQMVPCWGSWRPSWYSTRLITPGVIWFLIGLMGPTVMCPLSNLLPCEMGPWSKVMLFPMLGNDFINPQLMVLEELVQARKANPYLGYIWEYENKDKILSPSGWKAPHRANLSLLVRPLEGQCHTIVWVTDSQLFLL